MPSSSASAIARMPASGVRRSWETHETSSRREPSSRASRSRDSSSRRLVRASSAESACSSLGPRRAPTNDPCVSSRRASSRSAADHREMAAPTATATSRATAPDTALTRVTTPRSCDEMNISRAIATTPASTEPMATPTTSASCQKIDALADRPRQGQADEADADRTRAGHQQDLELVAAHVAASHR